MSELGVLPIFLENDILKVDKILRLTVLKARKDLEGFNRAFFNLLWLSFGLNELSTATVYSRRRSRFVNSAFSNKKILVQKSKFIYDNAIKFKRKCLQKFYVSSKQEKERYRKTTSYLEQPSRHFCHHFFMRITSQQTLSAVNLASQHKTNKALLFFSGTETLQTFSGSI